MSDRGISIHNLHPSHQGVYVCHATNKAGSITASAMLRVQVSKWLLLVVTMMMMMVVLMGVGVRVVDMKY